LLLFFPAAIKNTKESSTQWQLFTFSAKSLTSLRGVMLSTASYFEEAGDAVDLAAVADVLHRGREAFAMRACVVACSVKDAASKLRAAAADLNNDLRCVRVRVCV
jgi:acyl transferase domain-containing protein